MDCHGKKALEKQREVLDEINFVSMGRSATAKEYQKALSEISILIGKKIKKIDEKVIGVFTGNKKHTKIQRGDLDAVGEYVDHIILNKQKAKHIIMRHIGKNREVLEDPIHLDDLVHVSTIISESTPKLSMGKTGMMNHLYEKEINGSLYRVVVSKKKRAKSILHTVITYYKVNEGNRLLPQTPNKKVRDDSPLSNIVAKNEQKGKMQSIFDHVENIAGKVDKRVSPILTGGKVKRLITVDEVTKKIAEITNDFYIGRTQIHEQASSIKNFLDNKISESDSKLLHRSLTGDMNTALLPEHLRSTYKKIRTLIDANAKKLVEAGALKEEHLIKDYLKRYYEKYKDEKGLVDKMYFSQKFKKRQNLTYDERIALEMLEDANFVVPKTLAEQRIQLLQAQTLKNVADEFGSDIPLDGFVRMSDETNGGGIYKYGALAGKWVPKDVADAVRGAGIVKENLGILEQAIYPLIDHIKVNVTVKNPFTHLYNIGSNFMLAFLHGDMKVLSEVLYMATNDKKKFNYLVQKANKYGLNSYLGQMEKIEPFSNKNEHMLITIAKNAYLSKGSKLGDMARKMYDWEDKIFKLAAFHKHLKNGVDEKTAFRLAQEAYVDYSTPLPVLVRVLDKSGLSPFLHYSYKATPMVFKVIAKNPLRFAMLQAGLMGAGASAWFGDNKKENLFKPKWAESGLLPNVMGVKSWFEIKDGWYLNAGRLVPGIRFDGFDTWEFAGGFVRGGLNILAGKTPLGYSIGNKYDSTSMKVTKRALEMAKNYLPPITFGRYGQQFIGKVTGLNKPQNYYNEPLGYIEMGARGIGIRHFNKEKEVKSRLRALKNTYKYEYKKAKSVKEKREAKRRYNEALRRIKRSIRDKRVKVSM